MRADVLLVERGLAPSRTAAQRLIAGGHVFAHVGASRNAIGKPSVDVANDVRLEVEASELDRYVSRGGLKLDVALDRVALDVRNFVCLDVGQSTGGFTDCLLQRGVARVIGVDVGHDQLHAKLRNDSRVTCIEGVNARELTLTTVGAALPRPVAAQAKPIPTPAFPSNGSERSRQSRSYSVTVAYPSAFVVEPFDLIVADVSFISLTKVLPQWPAMLGAHGRVLSLVKPQFEVGAENLARGGIVRDESLFAGIEETIQNCCKENSLKVLDYFASSITGTDGNREFFVYAEKAT